MVQSAKKVDELKRRMDSLKEAKIPTQEYQKLQKELDSTVKKYDEVSDTVATFQKIGTDKNVLPFKQARAEAQDLYIKIEDLRGAMFELENSGKAFTVDQSAIGSVEASIQSELAKQKELNAQYDIAALKLEKANKKAKEMPGIFDRTLTAAQKAVSSISSGLKKVDGLLGKLASKAKSVFSSITKHTENAGNSVSSFGKRIRSLLLSMLVFEQIRKGLNSVFSGVQESFKNFAKYSSETNRVMSDFYGSLATLKNAIASAFAPIVSIAVPYLTTLVNYVTKAVSAVAQLIAALTGQSTWKKAKKQTVNYAGALDKTAASAKKAAGALAGFDDLDVLNKNEADTGADAGGSGVGDMWEEVPIDSKFADLAEKIKAIAEQLFAPIKKAWENQGQKVIEAWRYALEEIWKLIKDIGRDFLTVWNQEATVEMFENILLIIADIGLAVGHLAKNFRAAWNENNTGLKILQNIRDILAVIIANIKQAADATVKWAENLDFSPLLQAFERFTASLVPAIDMLSGALSDFYTMVLLPLGKWTLEKGLPDLLDVFTQFNERVDWEGLRSNLAEFWKHLEPFAERVGEGLILFIEDVSLALADFLNSETFEHFLETIENWMDNVDAEDVASALEFIAKALIGLKVAVAAFTGLEGAIAIIKRISDAVKFFSGGDQAKKISDLGTSLKGLGTSIKGAIESYGGLGSFLTADIGTTLSSGSFAAIGTTIGAAIIGGIIAAIGGWNFGQWLNETITGEEIDMSFLEQMDAIRESFSDGTWKEALSLWASDIGESFAAIGSDISGWWNETMVPFFAGIGEWINVNVVQPVGSFFQAMGETIHTIWTTICTTIGTIINNIRTTISSVLAVISSIWNTIWTTVSTVAKTIWTAITGTISAVINGIRNTISTVLNAIKTVWDSVWGSLKTTVTSIFNAIWGAIKKVINSILGGIENMANGVVKGINAVINALNGLKFTVPDWVPVMGGKTFGFNIKKLSEVSLPRLAEGAVFHGGNPYAAIVNDQPKGQTNIEAPLNTIKQAVAEVMASNNTNNTPSFQIFIGNEQLDDYIVTAGNREILRSGGY